MRRFIAALWFVALCATATFAQIDEDGSNSVVSTPDNENMSVVDEPSQVDSIVNESGETSPEASQDKTEEEAPRRLTEDEASALMQKGKSQRTAGTALTAVGAAFMGAGLVYTVMFEIDKQIFGIFLGRTSNGYMMVEYYLNPGIFGEPIGIPCLVVGIVKLIKGKIAISHATSREAALHVAPYLALDLRTRAAVGGLTMRF